jgi:hypothetical protein
MLLLLLLLWLLRSVDGRLLTTWRRYAGGVIHLRHPSAHDLPGLAGLTTCN